MNVKVVNHAIIAVPAADQDSPPPASYRRAVSSVYWLVHLVDRTAGGTATDYGTGNAYWSELAYVHDELCHVFVEVQDAVLQPHRFERIQDAEKLIHDHGLTEVTEVVLVKNRGPRG